MVGKNDGSLDELTIIKIKNAVIGFFDLKIQHLIKVAVVEISLIID